MYLIKRKKEINAITEVSNITYSVMVPLIFVNTCYVLVIVVETRSTSFN